jgi:hypothetical protein
MLGRLPKHIWPGALIKCIPEPPEGLDRFSLAALKGSALVAVPYSFSVPLQAWGARGLAWRSIAVTRESSAPRASA